MVLLTSQIQPYCSHFKVLKSGYIAYGWCEHLIHWFFLPPQILLVLRAQKYIMSKTWPTSLLPHGLLKNVMTMTIHMLHKAGLTSCCLPETCWLSAILIHLQNASAEFSIFNFERLKHFRNWFLFCFSSVVNRGIIFSLLHVKERTIDFLGKDHFSPHIIT